MSALWAFPAVRMAMRLLKTIFLTGLAVVAGMGCANATEAAAKCEWPFSRANAAMTGVSMPELKLPLTLAWQFKTMESRRASRRCSCRPP